MLALTGRGAGFLAWRGWRPADEAGAAEEDGVSMPLLMWSFRGLPRKEVTIFGSLMFNKASATLCEVG